jgi:hypothetical protein
MKATKKSKTLTSDRREARQPDKEKALASLRDAGK